MSGYVALRLSLPEAVVTWFVTGFKTLSRRVGDTVRSQRICQGSHWMCRPPGVFSPSLTDSTTV